MTSCSKVVNLFPETKSVIHKHSFTEVYVDFISVDLIPGNITNLVSAISGCLDTYSIVNAKLTISYIPLNDVGSRLVSDQNV